jgi:UDP-glucose 4-epimerase
MSEKVVVTGGAGFIGSHVVRTLLDDGYEVHVIDNFAGGLTLERLHEGAAYHKMDITNPESRRIFQNAAYVFHLAALPRVQLSIENPYDTHEANITGTLCVLLAAKEAGVKKVVYSASSSAYGDQSVMPLTESMQTNPKSPYALQKHAGELYCRLFSDVYGLPTVSLRYFNVYGPGADPNGAYALVIAKFLQQRAEGKPMTITGDGTQTRDFTHVRDVVQANLLAATSEKVGRGEVINIGAGKNASVNTIAELVGGPVGHIPARLEPHDTLADNSLAKKLLNWEPQVSLEDGIAELKKIHNLV